MPSASLDDVRRTLGLPVTLVDEEIDCVGVGVVPGMVIPQLPDGTATALGVGVIAAVLTASAHGVLAAATTLEPQPRPAPVPLRRDDA